MTRRIRPALRALLAALALLAAPAVPAQNLVTEVIPVGYRSAAELVPILQPLIPPPGGVSGISNQLVIRTTPENLEEIRGVLASIDRAPANLMISVRHTLDEEIRRDLVEAFGAVRDGDVTISTGRSGGGRGAAVTVESDSGSTGRVRVLSTQRAGSERVEGEPRDG